MRTSAVVAVWLASVTLFLSCKSDDDDDSVVTCRLESEQVCVRAAGTPQECTDQGGELVASCPTGAAAQCRVTAGEHPGTYYFYDKDMVDSAGSGFCSEVNQSMAEEEDAEETVTISCVMPVSGYEDICGTGEMSGSGECTNAGGTVVDACPSGALLTCNVDGGTIYFYDQELIDAATASGVDICSSVGGP
jgi:hypothetical protein